MENTFFAYASDGGRNALFGLPATEELTGRTARFPDGTSLSFESELAVKCDDDLFLADTADGVVLVEELPDGSLTALDAASATAAAGALPEELEGWETELSLATGYVLVAAFREGAVTLRPSPEPVIPNPFAPGGAQAPKAPEAPAAQPLTLRLQAIRTGDKRFLLRFPETGETVFFDGRRFLLYALTGGRIATGFVEIPPKE